MRMKLNEAFEMVKSANSQNPDTFAFFEAHKNSIGDIQEVTLLEISHASDFEMDETKYQDVPNLACCTVPFNGADVDDFCNSLHDSIM